MYRKSESPLNIVQLTMILLGLVMVAFIWALFIFQSVSSREGWAGPLLNGQTPQLMINTLMTLLVVSVVFWLVRALNAYSGERDRSFRGS